MPGTKRIKRWTLEESSKEPVVAEKLHDLTIKEEVKELAVRSVYPSRLKYIGAISGKEYQWAGAGAIVMVLSEDVPPLLEKRIGSRSCCGARQGGNQVFELTQEAQ